MESNYIKEGDTVGIKLMNDYIVDKKNLLEYIDKLEAENKRLKELLLIARSALIERL